MPFDDDIGIPYIDQSARVLCDCLPYGDSSLINSRLRDANALAEQFRDPTCDLPFGPSNHEAHRSRDALYQDFSAALCFKEVHIKI